MESAKQAFCSEKKVLPNSVTDQILDIYRPEFRFVVDAVFEDYSLDAQLKATSYPYTYREMFDYITAPTANLIGCQLSYVLAGGLIFFGTQHGSAPDLDWNGFLRLRDRALLKFSSFKLNFRKEVKNIAGTPCRAELLHTKRVLGHTHTDIRFEIGHGISGLLHGVILPE